MPGVMRCSRSWALPGKMILTRPISMTAPGPVWSCRDLTPATNRMSKLGWPSDHVAVVRSLRSFQQNLFLRPEQSAILRERLLEELVAIHSADEAAVWAQRNLPAKNALTAVDAKIVEERFQARLSAISDGQVPDGTTPAVRPMVRPPDQPPHVLPTRTSCLLFQRRRTPARKLRRRPRSALAAG